MPVDFSRTGRAILRAFGESMTTPRVTIQVDFRDGMAEVTGLDGQPIVGRLVQGGFMHADDPGLARGQTVTVRGTSFRVSRVDPPDDSGWSTMVLEVAGHAG